MNSKISDDKLDALIRESFEEPPEALRQKIQHIPEQIAYQASWSVEARFDSIIAILSGVVGFWILGLVYLYRDYLTGFLTGFSTYSGLITSIYFLVPFIGLISAFVIFSKYLFPRPPDCVTEPC